ncbi:DUF3990 domain-containing protein [Priestia megaterium]|uniref:DUF3990 domain-containing protein n=1 Tax=Priestia megaterium TaxID=1404 RepID=UPI00406BA039
MIVTEDIIQLPRTWYHGTSSLHINSLTRKGINVDEGRKKADFGRGFYLTANWEQAYRWAKSTCKRESAQYPQKQLDPLIVECKIHTEAFRELEYKMFTQTDIAWAKFILENRTISEKTAYPLKNNHEPGIGIKALPNIVEETMEQVAYTRSPYHCIYGPMADGRDLRNCLERVKRGKMSENEFVKQVTSKKYKFPISHQLSINTHEASHYVELRGVFNIAKGTWQHPVTSMEA